MIDPRERNVEIDLENDLSFNTRLSMHSARPIYAQKNQRFRYTNSHTVRKAGRAIETSTSYLIKRPGEQCIVCRVYKIKPRQCLAFLVVYT